MIPKIFVGTMWSGESEFEECCEAISRQKSVRIDQHIIKDLTEVEAHNALWQAWNSVKSEFDLFAKIDADTILNSEQSLLKVWQLFYNNPRVTGAQVQLHDYFTNDLIAGLNFFTPTVIFNISKKGLTPDRVDVNHDIVLKGESVKHLAPIGWHCKYPSEVQSFHFGLHRALKKQDQVLLKVAKVWDVEQDNARSWALTGAIAASFWMRNHSDYDNNKFLTRFALFKEDPQRLEKVRHYVSNLII